MEMLSPMGAALGFAFLCEGLTEYFFSNLLVALKIDTAYLRYLAALVGVTLCLAYGLDVFKDLLGVSARIDHLGEVVTGLALGRGANFLHQLYSAYGKRAG